MESDQKVYIYIKLWKNVNQVLCTFLSGMVLSEPNLTN